MKKIGILFAFLLFIAAGCNRSLQLSQSANNNNSNQAGQNAIQNVSMDISTWQSFVDKNSGFGFKYPQGWMLSAANQAHTVCLSPDSNQACSIGLNIAKAPDERAASGVVSNEDLIRAFEKKYSSESINKSQAVVNGLHTLKYSVAEETEVFIETAAYDYVFFDSSRNAQVGKILDGILSTISVSNK